MLNNQQIFIRLSNWLAIGLAALVAVGTPAAYLYFGYERETGTVQGESNVKVNLLSQLISGNPQYWRYESLRITDLIADGPEKAGVQLNSVVSNNGEIIAQSPVDEPIFHWPTITRQQTLYDYGDPTGRLVITKSLEALYQQTLRIAMVSLLMGMLIYWGLRVVPLRLLKTAWNKINHLATHDSLTGLPNRALFRNRLEHLLTDDSRTRNPVTIYCLDLDRFKEVNDTFGHAAGDQLLIQAAERITACLRKGDTIARLGGDEFAIIQAGNSDPSKAAELAERVIFELDQPFDLNGQEVVIGTSIGAAIYAGPGPMEADELLKNADLALYKSKGNGRGTFHFFHEEMNEELIAHKSMEADIRKALRDDEFELYYQPQVNLSNRRITVLEALLRWSHKDRGNVPLSEFLPVADSTGLIRPLSEWVLRTACRNAISWAPLRVAVNLSPSLLLQKDLVTLVKNILEETGLPANRLELEITEDILTTNADRVLGVLTELKDLGICIAMDDFGTGCSGLSCLRRFPFDKIKIDQSFINEIDERYDAHAIVRAIVSMGRALNMQITAEGVETIEQANDLGKNGCEEIQGFLYARPMKKVDIDKLLDTSRLCFRPQDPTQALKQTA
jgi:diguanylate cyclase (GGDEF)-like protein